MAKHNAQLVTLAVVAAAIYAAMWIGYVQNWAWLDAADSRSLRILHDYGVARPGWVHFWDVFCTVLGPAAFRLAGLAMIVVALLRRELRTAVFLVISIELSWLVTDVAKNLAGRPRPATALVPGYSTSFPSGHALGVMVAVPALLTVLLPIARRWMRIPMIITGALIVILIGFGRVVLNVHHASDVLAGWALGYLYYLLCVLLVAPARLTSADETPAALDSAR
jgi:membrane-associated phospholipid phosphatase